MEKEEEKEEEEEKEDEDKAEDDAAGEKTQRSWSTADQVSSNVIISDIKSSLKNMCIDTSPKVAHRLLCSIHRLP